MEALISKGDLDLTVSVFRASTQKTMLFVDGLEAILDGWWKEETRFNADIGDTIPRVGCTVQSRVHSEAVPGPRRRRGLAVYFCFDFVPQTAFVATGDGGEWEGRKGVT